jgi:hypothetical protein
MCLQPGEVVKERLKAQKYLCCFPCLPKKVPAVEYWERRKDLLLNQILELQKKGV